MFKCVINDNRKIYCFDELLKIKKKINSNDFLGKIRARVSYWYTTAT